MTEERTLYSEYLKPTLDYVIGLGEAIVLAVFFRVAADQSQDILVQVLAFLMMIVVGLYVGMPLGLLLRPFSSIKTPKLWLALLITMPLAIGVAAAANRIGHELSGVVRQLAKGATH